MQNILSFTFRESSAVYTKVGLTYVLTDIRVIIVGVGDGLNSKYVQCLTQSDDDFIPVGSFSTDDFNSIMGGLSDALCPRRPTSGASLFLRCLPTSHAHAF